MQHDVKVMVRMPKELKRRIRAAARAKLTNDSAITREALLAFLAQVELLQNNSRR